MLTGTLVTVAGFVPVGFAKSGAGEYCFTLFAVVGIALIVSWVVAVLFTPLTGIFILPDTLKKHGGHGSSRFSRWFHRTLDNALRNKARVLVAAPPRSSCSPSSACASCSSSSSPPPTGPSCSSI